MKTSPILSVDLAHRAIDEGLPVYELTSGYVLAGEREMIACSSQQVLLEAAGCTREEIAAVIERTKVTIMAKKEGISLEEAKLFAVLEKQYLAMVSALERYTLLPSGREHYYDGDNPRSFLPSWKKIKSCLSVDVLERVRRLEEPILVIVPPVTRQAMVEAINAHNVKGKEHDTYTHQFENNDLWNGGRQRCNDEYEVVIVTGVQDVQDDPSIQGTNNTRAKKWLKKYASQGIDVVNDAQTYLALMINRLAVGKPIDRETWTVVNAKNLTETSVLIAGGRYYYDERVIFSIAYPGRSYVDLRLRGLVRIR